MHIAIITTTRADWGLLSPVARELRRLGVDVDVITANMHHIAELGNTYKEVASDGFTPAATIAPGASPSQTAALTLAGTAEAIETLRPDASIILGDRYEALAAAQGCVLSGCPLIHIAGGAISEGAFDDSFRHAITKLARLHLVETEEYRRRVIQLGETPESVVTTGAIGLHNLLDIPPLPKDELERSIGFSLGDNCLLVTMHAATLSPTPPLEQIGNLLEALAEEEDFRYIITYPNNDTDPAPLITAVESFALKNPHNVRALPSLGMRRYASALHYVKGVAGNSSSGIVEAPSAGIPTLDIGIRQKGRTAAPSVVHCGESREEIVAGLRTLRSEKIRQIASRRENPYYKPDTLNRICKSILSFPFASASPKHFYDI